MLFFQSAARAMRIVGCIAAFGAANASDPWADAVVSYVPGANVPPPLSDPLTVLGEPARMTGSGDFTSVVSIYNGAYLPEQIVSIGAGGNLTVRFDEPIRNDPGNPFGVDLIVFGNGFFFEDSSGIAGSFAEGPMNVSVSANGVDFFSVGIFDDASFPTQGYSDSGPFDGAPGSQPTNFLMPINPALTLNDFLGLSYAEALALYGGSGGGIPIDIDGTGLNEAFFVRIDIPEGTLATPEIDAFAAVPEPGAAAAVGLLSVCALRRRS